MNWCRQPGDVRLACIAYLYREPRPMLTLEPYRGAGNALHTLQWQMAEFEGFGADSSLSYMPVRSHAQSGTVGAHRRSRRRRSGRGGAARAARCRPLGRSRRRPYRRRRRRRRHRWPRRCRPRPRRASAAGCSRGGARGPPCARRADCLLPLRVTGLLLLPPDGHRRDQRPHHPHQASLMQAKPPHASEAFRLLSCCAASGPTCTHRGWMRQAHAAIYHPRTRAQEK